MPFDRRPDETYEQWRLSVIRHCRDQVAEFWSSRAALVNDVQARSTIERNYLDFGPARILAAFRVLPAKATRRQVLALAREMQPVARQTRRNNWHLRPKNGGGFRKICSLSPHLKAVHYLIADLLQRFCCFPDFNFSTPSTGLHKAMWRVQEALEGGYTHCYVGDVRSCFDSVRAENLYSLLPLTEELVRYNLQPELLRFRYVRRHQGVPNSAGHSNSDEPSGLLQGSPASNMILAVMFDRMVEIVEHRDAVVCLYADNVFLAARSADELEATIVALRSYLGNHPGGSFDLRDDWRPEPGQPFEFLGYEVSPLECGRAIILPTEKSFDKVVDKMERAYRVDVRRNDGHPIELADVYWGARGGYGAVAPEFLDWLDVYAGPMVEDVLTIHRDRIDRKERWEPNLGDDAP